MRVYFEKPRTTVGWKGYINDPHLDGSFAINEGLELARQLLLDVLALGLPAGTEFLDLLTPAVHRDLISWGAIGARTTESQSHRQLAAVFVPGRFQERHRWRRQGSGRRHPGRARVARFMGMTKMGQAAIFETRGNEDCHVILRGGKQPNYHEAERRRGLRDAQGGGAARAGDDRRARTPTAASSTSARSPWPTTWRQQIAAGERASRA